MSVPAVETTALTKEVDRGRRTIWQRIRREADRRERFRAVDGIDLRVEHVALGVSTAAFVALGVWAFRAADRHVSRHGTVGQH